MHARTHGTQAAHVRSAHRNVDGRARLRLYRHRSQRGYLSYPRTETDRFKEGTDLRTLLQTQATDGRWGGFASGLLNGGFRWPRDGGHDDNAHPPIHPVKADDGLNGDEKRLYELVARRFVACCADDALGHETAVTLEMAGEVFSSSGLMILERNYLEVPPACMHASMHACLMILGRNYLEVRGHVVPPARMPLLCMPACRRHVSSLPPTERPSLPPSLD